MSKTLGELARLVNGEIIGDEGLVIRGVASVEEAKEGDITFAVSEKFLRMAESSKASAVVVPSGIDNFCKPVIKVENPRLAFAKILEIYAPAKPESSGIHKTAVISDRVKIGKGVTIGPYSIIEEGSIIEDNVYLSGFVYLGREVFIGEGTFIHPRVTILDRISIGKKVIIHSGTVIGSDGFGFVRKMNGSYYKIPQIGRVVIEDNVEIGANVTIDRATTGETRIGQGTKIDNLVHIAHNVSIGSNVAIVALVGISGSCKIGSGVILAGQAGVTDHVCIGDNTVVAAKSGVTKDVPSDTFVSGFPARNHIKQKKVKAMVNRLPELVKRVQRIEKMLGDK
ncbi:UDP-3-O-(3-hydroxymyristoyl)glucosamine N-acyltransferase [Candidatus Aerophobetes bacterium]|uniref:UDP-3-O-acylglucosamine N-acyltransferase n=1 Tax=Aerophobetes bacterium TaxID=2030807 RepID=A0A662DI05_UNCAE|nr:MAG: UDP-3-O-(3-hydroxymyristoyl)glucosamine N-acyltransferase [Candidatus Aerophobetes bacterium]